MQPSIPWSSSVSVFVIERMAIIHSLKCTVPFSLVVPLLSLAVTHCYLLSLVVLLAVTLCHLLHHSLSLVVIRYHSLSLVVTRCATRCTTRCTHSLSLVIIRCHSLSLDVQLICLFINNPRGRLILVNFNKKSILLLTNGTNFSSSTNVLKKSPPLMCGNCCCVS